MDIFKSLSIIACSGMLLVSCKTAQLTRISSPITYSINESIAVDSSVVNYYLPFKAKMETEMNRVIGESEVFLNKDRAAAETLVGNFFTDAILKIGKSIDADAQVAIATKGGIRSEIKKGEITVGDIFQVMPFENAITILKLKGTDMLVMANFIAKTGGQPLAGMTLDIKDKKPLNIKITGQELDTSKTYTLVTYDYLANGGDYIEGILNPVNRINTDVLVRNGLIHYIEELTKEGKTINTQLDGRVKIIK